MTQKQRILEYISMRPGVTDAELADYFQKSHQAINTTCRGLKNQNLIFRAENPNKNNHIGNYPVEILPGIHNHPIQDVRMIKCPSLDEEEIKHILTDFLKENGWDVETAWGHMHGVDIEAHKGSERWLIEVKGPGSRSAMRTNYFLSILGETLRRMDDPTARYSIAFPDMKKYRTLWSSLPQLAKERTTIDLLLIDVDGTITVLK